MDQVTQILVDALRQGAEGEEVRLYRAGKLPGLFPSRGSLYTEIASQAVGDGLIEIVRTETKGKTTTEWAKVTPRGMAFLVEQESPVRAIEELSALLRLNHEGIPAWLQEMRGRLTDMERRFTEEVQAMARRLETLAQRVTQALKRGEKVPEGAAGALPWGDDALAYLEERARAGHGGRCPLPELFAALRRKNDELTVRDFHSGLRRLHDRGLVRLLPCDGPEGPPEPEYALLDGAAVYYFAAR